MATLPTPNDIVDAAASPQDAFAQLEIVIAPGRVETEDDNDQKAATVMVALLCVWLVIAAAIVGITAYLYR